MVRLPRHFDAIAISGEIGICKPDSAIFRVALEHLGISAQDAWHVGDSLQSDVAGANATGMTSVWLNRPDTERSLADPAPDLEVASLTEVLLAIDAD